ncbi:MAG: 2-oxoglutarate dehydrogenase complex dihydrolipoyllysine-residue succinyltransferase [Planctomycetota bacterium]
MPTDLTVPEVGESISEVEIESWLKQVGDKVEVDEELVELATDKVNVPVPAPIAGYLVKILKTEGQAANVGDVIAVLDDAPPNGVANADSKQAAAPAQDASSNGEASSKAPPVADEPHPTKPPAATDAQPVADGPPHAGPARIMPAAQRLLDENNLNPADVSASGPGGRLLKEDVQAFLDGKTQTAGVPPQPADDGGPEPCVTPKHAPPQAADPLPDEERVRMTPLRRTIAKSLIKAQQTAALLTTFNEVDMTGVMELRAKYKEHFEKVHGVKLGFMSFFVKASIDALKQFPAVNAEVDGDHVVYKNHYDIGVAIGGGKGLVVPVLRNADALSFADVEKSIGAFAKRAKDNTLDLKDLQGGTFTITNGGVYGSLLSTPIVNPPQSGVLGMHGIIRRPIALGTPGKDERVEIRPMMYVALTYDHRIVDGREAVTFLRRIKDAIEDPSRMLLEA